MTLNENKYNIICLSNQLWDFPNWTNKKHVMSRLGKAGHNVLFVDPSLNIGKVLVRNIARGYWSLKRLLTQFHYSNNDNVYIYTPLNFVPSKATAPRQKIKKINRLGRTVFDKNKKTVLWIYNVELVNLDYYIKHLNYDILVYDCVDNYAGFPENASLFSTTVTKEILLKQESLLATKADIVFASAPGLVDRLKSLNKNTFFTPNVGDYEMFKVVPDLQDQIPEVLKNIPKPIIGFIGALDEYKFDANLVKKLAAAHKNYSIVLIGPLALKDKNASGDVFGFAEYPNIYTLGSVPYLDKKYYLAGFDVDIIPYVLNDYTIGGCFPVKFHDSLAAGLPVVVTDLPAYLPFKNVCYISKNYSEFISNVELALKENSVKKQKDRQLVAKENNWEGKVEKLLSLIGNIKK